MTTICVEATASRRPLPSPVGTVSAQPRTQESRLLAPTRHTGQRGREKKEPSARRPTQGTRAAREAPSPAGSPMSKRDAPLDRRPAAMAAPGFAAATPHGAGMGAQGTRLWSAQTAGGAYKTPHLPVGPYAAQPLAQRASEGLLGGMMASYATPAPAPGAGHDPWTVAANGSAPYGSVLRRNAGFAGAPAMVGGPGMLSFSPPPYPGQPGAMVAPMVPSFANMGPAGHPALALNVASDSAGASSGQSAPTDPEDVSQRSRHRNRMHARKSRQRKKLVMKYMQEQVAALEERNRVLRAALSERNMASILLGLGGQEGAEAETASASAAGASASAAAADGGRKRPREVPRDAREATTARQNGGGEGKRERNAGEASAESPAGGDAVEGRAPLPDRAGAPASRFPARAGGSGGSDGGHGYRPKDGEGFAPPTLDKLAKHNAITEIISDAKKLRRNMRENALARVGLKNESNERDTSSPTAKGDGSPRPPPEKERKAVDGAQVGEVGEVGGAVAGKRDGSAAGDAGARGGSRIATSGQNEEREGGTGQRGAGEDKDNLEKEANQGPAGGEKGAPAKGAEIEMAHLDGGYVTLNTSAIDYSSVDKDIDFELLRKDRSKCSLDELVRIRREGNRMHAKRTRYRKKLLHEQTVAMVEKLEAENIRLERELGALAGVPGQGGLTAQTVMAQAKAERGEAFGGAGHGDALAGGWVQGILPNGSHGVRGSSWPPSMAPLALMAGPHGHGHDAYSSAPGAAHAGPPAVAPWQLGYQLQGASPARTTPLPSGIAMGLAAGGAPRMPAGMALGMSGFPAMGSFAQAVAPSMSRRTGAPAAVAGTPGSRGDAPPAQMQWIPKSLNGPHQSPMLVGGASLPAPHPAFTLGAPNSRGSRSALTPPPFHGARKADGPPDIPGVAGAASARGHPAPVPAPSDEATGVPEETARARHAEVRARIGQQEKPLEGQTSDNNTSTTQTTKDPSSEETWTSSSGDEGSSLRDDGDGKDGGKTSQRAA